MSNFFCVRFK